MNFHESRWDIFVSSLMILIASVFKIPCRQQTDTQTNRGKPDPYPTPTPGLMRLDNKQKPKISQI